MVKNLSLLKRKSATKSCQLISTRKLCNLLKKKAVGAVLVLNNSKSQLSTVSHSIPPQVQEVLDEFQDVFAEPQNLPPPRYLKLC